MLTFSDYVDGFYDVAEQMNADLRRRAALHFKNGAEHRAELNTIEKFEAKRERIRAHLLTAIGGLPGPDDPASRSPLHAVVTSTVESKYFSVDKVLFQSLPNFFITASCYVPKDLPAPAPAIVFAQGHCDAGKSYPSYQAVCGDLARNGFIVLSVDPIGQGERSQYFAHGARLSGPSVYEHTRAGFPLWLCGKSVARYFIWDLMRGIDYLESRPDVDKFRIAITGNSGGGTQTSLMMIVEPRLAAAMPCTFPMTLESYQKTGQVQDSEQILYGAFTAGPDHDDFLTAIAPRPVMVGAVSYDFFPIEGTIEALERAKKIYKLYEQKENLKLVIDDNLHQYTPALRRACVRWFCRHLMDKPPCFADDEVELLPEQELYATSSGQVLSDFPDSRSIHDLIRDEIPAPPASLPVSQQRTRLADTLALKDAGDRSTPIHARVTYEEMVDGYRTEKIFFLSAPDIVVTGVLVHPRGSDSGQALPATILLLPDGSSDIPNMQPKIKALLRAGQRVFVFDVRGIGAVKARKVNGREDEPLGTEYKFGCDALMLGMSTLGLRVFDVLRSYEYLKQRRDVTSIHLHGLRSGATFAYFAAAVEEGFASVTCDEMLYSYQDWCETRFYNYASCNMKILVWNMLGCGDIVDLLPAIAPRPLRIMNPVNALGEVMETEQWREDFLNVAAERGYLHNGWQPKLSAH